MRLPISLALALPILLVSAAPASAGSVCMNGTVAVFGAADVATQACGGTDAPGEVNSLTVNTNSADDIVFTDSNPITDADGAGGCTVSGNTATCPKPGAYAFDLGDGADSATILSATAVALSPSTGGDGADTLTGGPATDSLDGGAGNDNVSGGDGDDRLEGGAGSDTVSGGAGNDSLEGGAGTFGCASSGGEDLVNGDAGDDALCGGDGPVGGVSDNDSLNGGSGVDHVFYPRSRPVTISLDGAVGDGEAGESDNVSLDIENATGGRGNDRLIGNDGPNMLDGAGGADSLSGMAGNDTLVDSGGDVAANTLDGGSGDDSLSAGQGPDVYTGGDGEDALIDYIGRTVSVSVTLDGQPDDGAAGEGDNVGPDVEDVTGGASADTLVGSASDNELAGGGGDDTVLGGAGNDGVFGQAGRDTLDGGAGRDRIDGGGGPDTLKSRDGQTDRVECGGGTDSGQGEARDDISGDCESVDIAAPTMVTIASVVVTRSGFVVVRVACPAVERSCAGAVTVKTVRRVAKRFIKLGQVNYRLRGGESKALRARISARDRKALKRAKRVKVRTVVTNANSDIGSSTTATRLATVTTRGL